MYLAILAKVDELEIPSPSQPTKAMQFPERMYCSVLLCRGRPCE